MFLNDFHFIEKKKEKKETKKKVCGGNRNPVALQNGDENLNFERFTFVRVPQMTSIAVSDNLVICDS